MCDTVALRLGRSANFRCREKSRTPITACAINARLMSCTASNASSPWCAVLGACPIGAALLASARACENGAAEPSSARVGLSNVSAVNEMCAWSGDNDCARAVARLFEASRTNASAHIAGRRMPGRVPDFISSQPGALSPPAFPTITAQLADCARAAGLGPSLSWALKLPPPLARLAANGSAAGSYATYFRDRCGMHPFDMGGWVVEKAAAGLYGSTSGVRSAVQDWGRGFYMSAAAVLLLHVLVVLLIGRAVYVCCARGSCRGILLPIGPSSTSEERAALSGARPQPRRALMRCVELGASPPRGTHRPLAVTRGELEPALGGSLSDDELPSPRSPTSP